MLIYGKEIREQMLNDIRQANGRRRRPMTLAVIVVGQEQASQSYVNSIVRFGESSGVQVRKAEFPATVSQDELRSAVKSFNTDESIDGIMVQTPLPDHIDTDLIINTISYKKDVEGLHNINLGLLAAKKATVTPATPKAVMRMLQEHGIDLTGRKVCLIGRSTVVGMPLALLLVHANATVTICHSRTRDLQAEIARAEIVIAAMGKMNFITEDMVSPEQVLIDVGTNFDENGKMVGDISAAAKDKAAVASAVPGGVGLITVAELFDNLCRLAAG